MGATSVTGVSGVGTVAGNQKGSPNMSLGVERLIGPRVVGAGQATVEAGNGGTSATVTFTVTGGVITGVTAAPAANDSGYPDNANVYLAVSGGGGEGGVVWGTTDGSGNLTFATTPLIGGSGYSGTTGAATLPVAIVFLPENTVTSPDLNPTWRSPGYTSHAGDDGLLNPLFNYIATAVDTSASPAAVNVFALTTNYLVMTGTVSHVLNWMVVKSGFQGSRGLGQATMG